MSSAWTILYSCCSCFWEVGKTSFQHTLTHCISWIQVVFWEHTASFRTINHNYKRTRLIRFHASWCKETRKISVAFYLILWNTALIVVPLPRSSGPIATSKLFLFYHTESRYFNYSLLTEAMELSGREKVERGIFLLLMPWNYFVLYHQLPNHKKTHQNPFVNTANLQVTLQLFITSCFKLSGVTNRNKRGGRKEVYEF